MRKWIMTGLIIWFALMFLVSGYLLVDYYVKDYKTEKSYDDLSNMVSQQRPDRPTPNEHSDSATEPTEPPLVEVEHPETGEKRMLLMEYAELFQMNPDLVGWIWIKGTKVDYPVMQTPDKTDYYLKRDFFKKYNGAGCIYAREQCDVFAPSDNITIYGHRMNTGAMFGELGQYEDEAFFKENRYIFFDTIEERHTYEVFSVFSISSSYKNGFQYHLFVDMDQEKFAEFVEQCKTRSLYDTGVTAEYGDKFITLSTCMKGNRSHRFVVVAKRVD